jgi:hypothetical protein
VDLKTTLSMNGDAIALSQVEEVADAIRGRAHLITSEAKWYDRSTGKVSIEVGFEDTDLWEVREELEALGQDIEAVTGHGTTFDADKPVEWERVK